MSELNDDPVKQAAERGLDLVLPGDGELQVDVDDVEDLSVMVTMSALLRANGVTVSPPRTTESPGGNTHVYLTVAFPDRRTVSATERIALQACLGSDRKRELLSLLRIMLDVDRPPTCFYERRRGTD